MRSTGAVRALETMLRPKPRLVRKECRSCGIRHTGVYEACGTCLELQRGMHAAWRRGQKQKGLCSQCVEKMDRGSVIRCTHHLQADAAHKLEAYRHQRAKGLCGWARCPEPSEAAYCEKHRARTLELAHARRSGAGRRQSLPVRRRA